MASAGRAHPVEVAGVAARRSVVEVHGAAVTLWRAELPAGGPPGALLDTLAASELERIGRIRVRERAEAAAWSRVLLRAVLAHELSHEAVRVDLVHGDRGKPALGPVHQEPLHFNVSHTGAVWIAALSDRHALGVDVERLRPLQHVDALARRALGPGDRERWEFEVRAGAPAAEAFLRAWASVEARAKALGTGVESHGGRLVPGIETVPWRPLGPEEIGAGLVGAVAVAP